jgi:hypothetical protein
VSPPAGPSSLDSSEAVEAGEVQLEVVGLEALQHLGQLLVVPARVLGDAVVRQAQGLLLIVAEPVDG